MLEIDLSEKKALVTGSARGIGAAIAKKLADAGADVVINSVHSIDVANALANKLNSLGVRSAAIHADVAIPDEAARLISEAEEILGGLDILVNNAGINRDTLLLRMDEAMWDEVLAANLKGVFNCTKAAAKGMVKQRSGCIVNISSVVGIFGNAGQVNYAAAKAGIIGFSKAVAKELGSRNIRVNVVAPGFIETDMTNKLSDKVKEAAIAEITLGRFGKADEVANVVGFLASDLASYINGQTIIVDGLMRG